MKNRILVAIALAAIVLLGILCGKKKEQQMLNAIWNPNVSLSIGQAFVKHTKDDAGKLARVGMKVFEGDVLNTLMESKMEIKLNNQDLLVVGENSKVLLNKEKNDNTYDVSAIVKYGKLFSRIKAITRGKNRFRVVTPTATAAIRGTDFTVEVDRKTKKTTVKISEGEVLLADNKKKGAVSIKSGEQASVTAGRAPTKPASMDAKEVKELKSWVEEGVNEERIALAQAEEEPNNAPAILTPYLPSLPAGTVLEITIKAKDKDDDPLSYSIAKGPEGMAIDEITGKIKWQSRSPGRFKVIIAVSDGKETVNKAYKLRVNKPLSASFNVSPAKGGTKTVFTFNASASVDGAKGNKGLAYAWDMDGDGRIDIDYAGNPIVKHRFAKPGLKRVKLVIKNEVGLKAERTKNLKLNDPPQAVIKVIPPSAIAGSKFKLDASGSSDSFDPLNRLQFRWDLNGDKKWDIPKTGFSKAKAVIAQIYKKPGKYQIMVEIRDSEGASSMAKAIVNVLTKVMARAGNDTAVAVNQKVTLVGEGKDKDGKIAKYGWDFNGDGKVDWSSAKSGKVTTTYKKEGRYTAVFSVKSSTGSVSSDTIIITVQNAPPKADAGKRIKTSVNTKVTLAGRGRDPDNKIVKYEWDFDGNGKFDWTSDSTGLTTTTYASAGQYKATLRVTSDDGKSHKASVTVIVGNAAPVAIAGEDIVSKKGKKVKLNGKGEDKDGNIAKYEWDFNGDGKFDWSDSTSGEVKHAFQAYTIAVLRVTDADKAIGLDTLKVIICPKGMLTVKEEQFCIDRYEWPNKKGKMPVADLSWHEAQKKCVSVGKRLCTQAEWVTACKSSEDNNFPYGNEYQKNACNTSEQEWVRKKGIAPSGKFPECKNALGVFDMSGNVMEWTDYSKGNNKFALGGSFRHGMDGADCEAQASQDPGKGYFFIGFRCCK